MRSPGLSSGGPAGGVPWISPEQSRGLDRYRALHDRPWPMAESEERWRELLAGEVLPAAIVDLDALEHNLGLLVAALGEGELRLRIACPSIRCTGVYRHLLLAGEERIQGLMTASAAETAMLAKLGFDDFLIGYPPGRASDARLIAEVIAEGAGVVVVVDHVDHVQILAAAAVELGVEIPVCIDVDVSWQPAAEMYFGVRRSPVRDSELARELATVIAETDGVQVIGLTAYESSVAQPPEQTATGWALSPLRRVMRRRMSGLATDRRLAVAQALQEDGHAVALVNGGGTGSIQITSKDPTVTETSVGSGFLCPTLCDRYGLKLKPAVFYALPVVRRADDEHFTCFGGGFMCGGPSPQDRAPIVHVPRGVAPIEDDGWGLTQTTFRSEDATVSPQVGDVIICRPSRVGPLMERFVEVLFVRGDEIVERAPTYRGLGASFG